MNPPNTTAQMIDALTYTERGQIIAAVINVINDADNAPTLTRAAGTCEPTASGAGLAMTSRVIAHARQILGAAPRVGELGLWVGAAGRTHVSRCHLTLELSRRARNEQPCRSNEARSAPMTC